jgi:hypothetical protein
MLTRKTTGWLALVVGLAFVYPGAARAWTWPSNGPVLRGFAFGGAEYREHGHTGIDIGANAGSPVRAPAGGRISFAGWLPGHGRTVTIRTSDDYAVTLLHLGSIAVAADDGVAEGEPVGTVGPSGDAEVDVPYVHLGVRRADDPKGYLDPLTLLPPRRHRRLPFRRLLSRRRRPPPPWPRRSTFRQLPECAPRRSEPPWCQGRLGPSRTFERRRTTARRARLARGQIALT